MVPDGVRPESVGRRLTRVKRLTDRFLPHRFAPADFEERARRDFEFLVGDAVLGPDALSDFEPAAVPDRRCGRFFHRHQEIAAGFVAVSEFGDACPAEESQRGEAALALSNRREAERIPALQLQLTLDGLRPRRRAPAIST